MVGSALGRFVVFGTSTGSLAIAMPASVAQQMMRAFVKVMVALAALYSVPLNITRDSPDAEVKAALRRLVRKVHPDKGGSTVHAQQLQSAKDEWEKALGGGHARQAHGRPGSGAGEAEEQAHQNRQRNQPPPPPPSPPPPQPCPAVDAVDTADPEEARKVYRIHAPAVLMAYNGCQDLGQWHRFLAFVRSHVKQWCVKHWCVTLETSKADKMHVHLMLQFKKKTDRTSRSFAFEGILPRCDQHDLLGEGWCRKKMQESINRGMFYCWADKIGTQFDESGKPCTDGNYQPCWTRARTTYPVKGRWPESLWKARKLTHEKYEQYLFATRDGVLPRKRNLDACREKEEMDVQQAEIQARVKRIRGNPMLFRPFPKVPQADAWLQLFARDRLRYPILVVWGPSHTGKTEWAKTLFKHPLELKVGTFGHFPSGMKAFNRKVHGGLILGDIRDLQFIVDHQEKVQVKYDALVEFASTPGRALPYTKDLFAAPIVVTVNNITKHLEYLENHDWLKQEENRILVRFPPVA